MAKLSAIPNRLLCDLHSIIPILAAKRVLRSSEFRRMAYVSRSRCCGLALAAVVCGGQAAAPLTGCYRDGDPQGSSEACSVLIAHEPKSAIAFLSRGGALGDLRSAAEDYTKAIEIDPRHDEAYNRRSSAYRKQGDLDRAPADATMAPGINPKSHSAYYARGEVYREKGNLDAAIEDYGGP
jgi:Tetratricopeptide repeat